MVAGRADQDEDGDERGDPRPPREEVHHPVPHEADGHREHHDDGDGGLDGKGAGAHGREALGPVDAAGDAEAADGEDDDDGGEEVAVFSVVAG